MAKKTLQQAICDAKARAWEDLLKALDNDPWGRPYKMVRNKLRPWAPPITEGLSPEILGEVIISLFPPAKGEG